MHMPTRCLPLFLALILAACVSPSPRNATLKEVLDAICDLAGLRWRIHKNGSILIE